MNTNIIEINNFPKIYSIIRFAPKLKSMILVWVIKRNKDGNTEVKGNNKNRTVKSYHFQTIEQLQQAEEEIITLCKTFNCRAYICINPKSVLSVLFALQEIVINHIKEVLSNETTISLKGMLDSAFMKASNIWKDKWWIVDVDSLDSEYLSNVYETIKESHSEFSKNVITNIPTISGCHFITHRFDTTKLLEKYPEIEIKKEGLTLLYGYINKN